MWTVPGDNRIAGTYRGLPLAAGNRACARHRYRRHDRQLDT